MSLVFHRDTEFERNRWWVLYVAFALIGMFFSIHFVLDVQSGEMKLGEALFVGGSTSLIVVGIVVFIKKSSRGRLELSLDDTTLLYVVGQAEHRLDISGGIELHESGTQWAFIHPTGVAVLVSRRAFPRLKQEIAGDPTYSQLIRASGQRYVPNTTLRTRIITGAVLLFALAYFALMLFGLLVKAGLVEGAAGD